MERELHSPLEHAPDHGVRTSDPFAEMTINRLLQSDTPELPEWRKLMSRLRDFGSDPNW